MPFKRKSPSSVASKSYQVDTVLREIYKKRGFKASTSDNSFEEIIETYEYPTQPKAPKLEQLARLESERKKFAAKKRSSFNLTQSSLVTRPEAPWYKSPEITRKFRNDIIKPKVTVKLQVSNDKFASRRPRRSTIDSIKVKKKEHVQRLEVTKPIVQKSKRPPVDTLFLNSKLPTEKISTPKNSKLFNKEHKIKLKEPKIYKTAYDIAQMTKEAMDYFKPMESKQRFLKSKMEPKLTELFRNYTKTSNNTNNYKVDGYTKTIAEEFERMVNGMS